MYVPLLYAPRARIPPCVRPRGSAVTVLSQIMSRVGSLAPVDIDRDRRGERRIARYFSSRLPSARLNNICVSANERASERSSGCVLSAVAAAISGISTGRARAGRIVFLRARYVRRVATCRRAIQIRRRINSMGDTVIEHGRSMTRDTCADENARFKFDVRITERGRE